MEKALKVARVDGASDVASVSFSDGVPESTVSDSHDAADVSGDSTADSPLRSLRSIVTSDEFLRAAEFATPTAVSLPSGSPRYAWKRKRGDVGVVGSPGESPEEEFDMLSPPAAGVAVADADAEDGVTIVTLDMVSDQDVVVHDPISADLLSSSPELINSEAIELTPKRAPLPARTESPTPLAVGVPNASLFLDPGARALLGRIQARSPTHRKEKEDAATAKADTIARTICSPITVSTLSPAALVAGPSGGVVLGGVGGAPQLPPRPLWLQEKLAKTPIQIPLARLFLPMPVPMPLPEDSFPTYGGAEVPHAAVTIDASYFDAVPPAAAFRPPSPCADDARSSSATPIVGVPQRRYSEAESCTSVGSSSACSSTCSPAGTTSAMLSQMAFPTMFTSPTPTPGPGDRSEQCQSPMSVASASSSTISHAPHAEEVLDTFDSDAIVTARRNAQPLQMSICSAIDDIAEEDESALQRTPPDQLILVSEPSGADDEFEMV